MTRVFRTSFYAVCAATLLLCMPCFNGSGAAQTEGKMFANAIEQRNEIIRQIEETNRLLKQQNDLLREALKRPEGK